MSFFSRMSMEMSNAFSDAYGNLVYGDDAGKSAKLVFVAKPRSSLDSTIPKNVQNSPTSEALVPLCSKFELGLTFLEVNGRAYVRNVIPDSLVEKAGVQPRDCVQFAAVLGGDLGDFREDDGKAALFALECEKRGTRTSFAELKNMFAGCEITDDTAVDDDGQGSENTIFETKKSKSSTLSNVATAVTTGVSRCGIGNHNTRTGSGESTSSSMQESGTNGEDSEAFSQSQSPPTQKNTRFPVVIVFRRTRKRQSLGGFAHMGVPSFRLDDECDRAASLIRRLAPTAETAPEPDAWDEIVHDGTEWLLPSGSIMPPAGTLSSPINIHGHAINTPALSPLSHISSPMSPPVEDQSHTDTLDTASINLPRNRLPNELKRSKSGDFSNTGEETIPKDIWEATSSAKIYQIRSQMHAEAMKHGTQHRGGADDLEAATIRGMIQKAVGLVFVRISKVVMGVSVHGGSGIIIGRLPDGTWSAPSSIGVCGGGLGIQFGLEVADYIFILQKEEALMHFRRGGSLTVGGNVGAAFAGLGREAYGATSVSGTLCSPRGGSKDYGILPENDDVRPSNIVEFAPIVAYARSQGLYFGVSLEGSRIFTREDINARTYKFTTGKAVSSADILGGKVATPPEAEDLYASLHNVEFAHEMSGIPRPPEILRKDSPNDWRYDRSTLSTATAPTEGGVAPPFSFLSTITDADAEELSAFETTFKKFLYGGVSVQRLVPNAEPTGGKTRRERRTLWLMLPEVGALRLGFISKLHDGDTPKTQNSVSPSNSDSRKVRNSPRYTLNRGRRSSDDYSIDSYSESMTGDDYTLASDGSMLDGTTTDTMASTVKTEEDIGAPRNTRTRNVHLSNKHSVALTDVTCLSQEPNVSIRFSPDDATEHLRVIFIQDVSGTSLLFLANNFREAELLVCGLKLLLERETARLGVRGGVPITQLGGKPANGAMMSPAQARGYLSSEGGNEDFTAPQKGANGNVAETKRGRSPHVQSNRAVPNDREPSQGSNGYSSSDAEDSLESERKDNRHAPHKVPDGRKSWSQVPGRHYLRDQASRSYSGEEPSASSGYTWQTSQDSNPSNASKYVYGQLIIRDIALNIPLPLPLPLCRVLLLDSSSPVITKWETDRGDTDYSKTQWIFPPATPRDLERHSSEHKLIASGSMMGAHRTTNFHRSRNGENVQLTETQIVEADDPSKVAFSITERLPRRGFSVKVRILLRSTSLQVCEATVLGEVRPMGKNMTNQQAVHRALNLVIEEIKMRYGTEGKGLLAGFLNVVNSFPNPNPSPSPPSRISQKTTSPQHKAASQHQYPYQQYPLQQQVEKTPTRAEPSKKQAHSSTRQEHLNSLNYQSNQPITSNQRQNTAQPSPTNSQRSTGGRGNSIQQNTRSSPTSSDQSSSSIRHNVQRRSISTQHHAHAINPSSPSAAHQTYTSSSFKRDGGSVSSTRSQNDSLVSFEDVLKPGNSSRIPSPKEQNSRGQGRPSTPSSQDGQIPMDTKRRNVSRYTTDKFEDAPHDENLPSPVTIEVKPLPKIRLDLMPAPREEDEDDASSVTPTPTRKSKSKSNIEKKPSSRRTRRSAMTRNSQ